MNIREEFGDIDIYLFDQLLKGRLDASMRLVVAVVAISITFCEMAIRFAL